MAFKSLKGQIHIVQCTLRTLIRSMTIWTYFLLVIASDYSACRTSIPNTYHAYIYIQDKKIFNFYLNLNVINQPLSLMGKSLFFFFVGKYVKIFAFYAFLFYTTALYWDVDILSSDPQVIDCHVRLTTLNTLILSTIMKLSYSIRFWNFLQLSTLVENYQFNVKIRDISFIFDQKKVLRYCCESDMALLQLEGPFQQSTEYKQYKRSKHWY